jgi:hypothetical protein
MKRARPTTQRLARSHSTHSCPMASASPLPRAAAAHARWHQVAGQAQ